MNAPVALSIAIRAADLRDAGESARLAGFVREAPEGQPFHLPVWLTAVERGTGQRAHCLVAERGGALSGILPLTEVHSPLFGRALVSTGFATGGGILAETPGAVDALANAAWALAERLSCPEVELRGGPVPEGWTRREGVYARFYKPLAASDEEELARIRRRQRAEVRKGLDQGFEVRIGAGPRDRAMHFAVYAESVRNHGSPLFPRALFDAVLDGFGEDADILTILHQGAPVSSLLNLFHRGVTMPYWGGGVRAARGLRANEIMYFECLKHARARGCTHADFGRSKVGAGAGDFKRHWGFEAEPLVYAGRTAPGFAPREINPNASQYGLAVRAWRRLPLPIANRLGPMIARGLG